MSAGMSIEETRDKTKSGKRRTREGGMGGKGKEADGRRDGRCGKLGKMKEKIHMSVDTISRLKDSTKEMKTMTIMKLKLKEDEARETKGERKSEEKQQKVFLR